MKFYIDNILLDVDHNGEWLSEYYKKNNKSGHIILTSKSIDKKWIVDIKKKSRNENGILIVDPQNRFYVLLYLIFSLKRRVHFVDYMYLYNAKDDFTLMPDAVDVQQRLWDMLLSFMNENTYEWKLIKDNAFTYEFRARVPFSYYNKSEWLTLTGTRLFLLSVKHSFDRRLIKTTNYIWKTIAHIFFVSSLKKIYKNVVEINIKSGSGNLFFKASDDKKRVFVKAGNRYFTDIENEIRAICILQDNTINHELYMIPEIAEFSDSVLLSPFDPNQLTLKDAVEKNLIGVNEIKLLIDFCIKISKDLNSIDMIHRDIQPANFLLLRDDINRIVGFKLMDFGCATSKRKSHKKGIRYDIIERYAGNMYRYSTKKWNDAASMFYMIMQLKDFDWDLFKDEMRILFDRIECSK